MFRLHFYDPAWRDPAFWFMVIVLAVCVIGLGWAQTLVRRS